jgi:hypothetical protein
VKEILKNKFKKSPTSKPKSEDPAKAQAEGKVMRNWMGVSDKISKKDMEKIDVSLIKGGEIDIEHQKEIYLGGDNDVLEGFYNSDDEVDFENFKKGKKG